ncbi:MAG TPA: hypothetical protein PKJ42_08680 [Candidatus Goldiibacteriota bacterium]|nr:hypothetical protein [Candidatus Goldiibacteriota bacterium]
MKKTEELKNFLTGRPEGLFLYSAPKTGGKSYLFTRPLRVIRCNNLKSLITALKTVSEFTRQGYYAAGFMAYEAGYGFEKKFRRVKTGLKTPFLEFGIYKAPHVFSKTDICALLPFYKNRFSVSPLKFSEGFKSYKKKFRRIMKLINNGMFTRSTTVLTQVFIFRVWPRLCLRRCVKPSP